MDQDAMTSLYSKTAMQELIADYLHGEGEGSTHFLLDTGY